MKSYRLIRIGKLFAARTAIEGPGGLKILTLLVDTGSTYTIIPVEALEAIGNSPVQAREHVRIVTGSGILIAPQVIVPIFQCLGKKLKNFDVVGHTLPPAGPIDGLLGLDFLCLFKARLDLNKGELEIT